MNRKIQPNSKPRGEHGLRSDEEWQSMLLAMKRLQYDIIAPITGATFTKLQKFTPSTEHVSFEGDYDLMLPDANIILWRGISYLAGEALIELNVEGSIIVEPCARILYNFDEAHNGAMEYPPANLHLSVQSVQPQLSWLPLSFWTPEMHKAQVEGTRSNKPGEREKLVKRYQDEGREIWTGIKLLKGAQLIRTPETLLLSRSGHQGETLAEVERRLQREAETSKGQAQQELPPMHPMEKVTRLIMEGLIRSEPSSPQAEEESKESTTHLEPTQSPSDSTDNFKRLTNSHQRSSITSQSPMESRNDQPPIQQVIEAQEQPTTRSLSAAELRERMKRASGESADS